MNEENLTVNLSIVVPITRMSGRMQNLRSWLTSVTQFDVEVILVHDRQDLNTSTELEALCKTISSRKVKVFEQNFGNPGDARNFGKNHTTGNFITFCDSDDVLHIENIMKSLSLYSDYDVIIGTFVVVDSGSRRLVTSSQAPKNAVNLAMNPGLWRFIFRSEILDNLEFMKFLMGEDQLFLAETKLFSSKIKIVDSVFYDYYVNDKSQLTSDKGKVNDLFGVLLLLEKLACKVTGDNKNFTHLLIVKNYLTMLKNYRVLTSKNKKAMWSKFFYVLTTIIFKINWMRAFNPMVSKT